MAKPCAAFLVFLCLSMLILSIPGEFSNVIVTISYHYKFRIYKIKE